MPRCRSTDHSWDGSQIVTVKVTAQMVHHYQMHVQYKVLLYMSLAIFAPAVSQAVDQNFVEHSTSHTVAVLAWMKRLPVVWCFVGGMQAYKHVGPPGVARFGSNRCVSKAGPRWLVAKWISWPCLDCEYWSNITPALCTCKHDKPVLSIHSGACGRT